MVEINLTIRQADIKDTNLLSALATTSFYEAYFEQDASINLADYVVESFNAGQMKGELEDANSLFFIAEFGERALGYAKLRQASKIDCVTDEKAIELQRIYVLEKMKGKNIGVRLMERCFEESRQRGYSTIWLGVWQYNPAAQKFYEKLGFHRVGEMKFEYASNIETNYVYIIKL
jgi:ribosomal protein S18 acetylase RimI-like enzyme